MRRDAIRVASAPRGHSECCSTGKQAIRSKVRSNPNQTLLSVARGILRSLLPHSSSLGRTRESAAADRFGKAERWLSCLAPVAIADGADEERASDCITCTIVHIVSWWDVDI